MNSLRMLWQALSPRQRRRCVLLQFLALAMGLATVTGLAAVMPFFAVLADPALVETSPFLSSLRAHLGLTEHNDFLLALGGGFVLLMVISAIVNLSGAYAMGRYVRAAGDRIRAVLFDRYLRRDYPFHARTGAAPLVNDVLYQVDQVTNLLLNGFTLITNGVLAVLVLISIAIINPMVAGGGLVALAGSYLLVWRLTRRRVVGNGHAVLRSSAQRLSVVQQAFFGIKYLQVAQAYGAFSAQFAAASGVLSRALADTQFLGQFPRYVLECVAGVAVVGGALLVGQGDPANGAWLAELSFIGLATLRLLPAFQQMYYAMVIVRSCRPALQRLAPELAPLDESTDNGTIAPPRRLEAIALAEVAYRYAPEAPRVLDGVSVRITAGSAVGIVGSSGSGKTTLVDIILGLLVPESGRVEIDGQTLTPDGIRAWQQRIGYVPQEVAIFEASVRENIAFGLPAERIDDERVRESARQAGAAAFIDALPGGYDAVLSAQGAILSGGQRQRIGIARALYADPQLLVLDEATNALDADTERAIVDTVVRNRGGRTLIVIAHDDAAINACDRVLELRAGVLHERAPVALRV